MQGASPLKAGLTPELVTVGWLTIDDIVLPNGACERSIVGGGALYSAVGACIWNDRVGLHSVIGRPYRADVCDAIERYGLDTAGVNAIDGNGLLLWLLHESAHDKQQVPKLSSSSAAEMDEGRAALPASYCSARGFHIAPQSPDGSFSSADQLNRLPTMPVITLDILSDAFVDVRLYNDLAFLNRITAFLPSREEVERIWRPADLEGWLHRQAVEHGCHVAAKVGDAGSLVCEAHTGRLYRIPCFPATVLDTTGAGDAYCGGFLSGLIDHLPIQECAARGTVSASFVIEARGALATEHPNLSERDERFSHVLSQIDTRSSA